MKRKYFNELGSKEKIYLKKYFFGASVLPELLKFEIKENKIFWKDVILLEEHTLLDIRLNYIFNNGIESGLSDGTYWTNGKSLYNLNKPTENVFILETIQFSEITEAHDILYFRLPFNNVEYWNCRKDKARSDVITTFLLQNRQSDIQPFFKSYSTNEESLIMHVFENTDLTESDIIQPKFEPYKHYDRSKIPIFLTQAFKTDWGYRGMILGLYQKILTKPTDETLILLECLNLKIYKK